ncbi:hypothetical protein HOE31_02890 [bacterium]|jgi:hypothetical protein|nr:hypothetical protein [bacterium]MBT4121870.1 hypothetical protein [bacterium]MBT4334864.1 hypothetical protein [bacterium]MBT4496060.1 hypothetical protein [bacterium]MBT4764011.1 hypothetical protein [bacterium]
MISKKDFLSAEVNHYLVDKFSRYYRIIRKTTNRDNPALEIMTSEGNKIVLIYSLTQNRLLTHDYNPPEDFLSSNSRITQTRSIY